MLTLTRRAGEIVCIGDDITVTVLGIYGNKVRLGITGPLTTRIDRGEVRHRIEAGEPIHQIEDDLDHRENQAKTTSTIPAASLSPEHKTQ